MRLFGVLLIFVIATVGCRLDDNSIEGSIGTEDSNTSPAPSPSPAAPVIKPLPPTGLVIETDRYGLSETPTISWTAATVPTGGSAISHYKVEALKSSDDSVLVSWSTVSSGANFTGLFLQNGETYYYKVKTVDINNVESESVNSSTWQIAEMGAAGVLDINYSSDGLDVQNFSTTFALGVTKTVVDGYGRIVTMSNSGTSPYDIVVWRYLADGTLDTSFNGTGFRIFDNIAGGGGADKGNDLAIDAYGRILIVGHSDSPSDEDIIVLRLKDDGSYDTSFSGDGIFISDSPAGGNDDDEGHGIEIDKNGKIYVAGHSRGTVPDVDAVILRLNDDGTLDTSFSGDGIYIHSPTNIHDYFYDLKIDGLGRIVAVGSTGPDGDGLFSRISSAGVIDTTFNGVGYLTSDAAAGGSFGDRAALIELDHEGNILTYGAGRTAGFKLRAVIWKILSSNGTLDTTFDGDGILVPANPTGSVENVMPGGFKIDANGRFLITGQASTATDKQMFVISLNSDGTLNTNFNTTGSWLVKETAGVGYEDFANSISIDDRGLIVIGGVSKSGTTGSAFVRRMYSGLTNSVGSLDTSFDSDGVQFHDNAAGGSNDDTGVGIVFDWLGNITVSGKSSAPAAKVHMGLWQYNKSGAFNTAFDTDGYITHIDAAGGNNIDLGGQLLIDNDGRFIVAGSSWNGGGNMDMTVWRSDPDGSLDTSFDADGFFVHNNAAGGSASDLGNDVLLDGFGNLVVIGSSESAAAGNDMTIWRLSPNGSLDTTFDGDGIATHNNAAGGSGDDQGFVGALDPQGRILVAGLSTVSGAYSTPCIWRYKTDGTIDTTFNTTGYKTFETDHDASGTSNAIKGIVLDGSGKILVTGQFIQGGQKNLFVYRLNENGTLDTTFNSTGSITEGQVGFQTYGEAIAIDQKGAIVVTGALGVTNLENLGVWRYHANGQRDLGFNSTGHFSHDSAAGGGLNDSGSGLTINSLGELFITGLSKNPSGNLDMVIWKIK